MLLPSVTVIDPKAVIVAPSTTGKVTVYVTRVGFGSGSEIWNPFAVITNVPAIFSSVNLPEERSYNGLERLQESLPKNNELYCQSTIFQLPVHFIWLYGYRSIAGRRTFRVEIFAFKRPEKQVGTVYVFPSQKTL